MNNREWLNTLSDEEQDKVVTEKMLEFCINKKKWAVRTFDDALKMYQTWLSKPHETTADEDFAEIGFDLTSKPSVSSYLTYRDSNNRIFHINNDGNNEYDVDEDGGEVWNDKLIDKIRTIADKKRKEVWG